MAEGIKESGSSADKAEAGAVLASIPARVFIHVGDEGQRVAATTLGEALKRQGFAVQGVEKVAAVPNVTSVRYFNEEDSAAADSIASTLKQNGVTDAVAKRVTRYKVRPGSLEVWLSAAMLKRQ
ncbi:MAG: LytR C-terminal domain-containing protein [Pseudomonadota bacterium]|nr:LytR C-terminal domain-containing protein [Pseudomonadota bacterium]MDP1902897.1 LytR C-terminal domain-containing protein [Pseudomonadota bacterium]MDP2350943.1 LytR C-terminal domain-containing protein [Pseudomonadota bacterium]